MLEDVGGFLLSFNPNIKEVEEAFNVSEGVKYKYTELGRAIDKILCFKEISCK